MQAAANEKRASNDVLEARVNELQSRVVALEFELGRVKAQQELSEARSARRL